MTLNTIDPARGRRASRWLALAGTAAALAACGGGGGDGADVPAGQGSLRIALTDAPSCYENVFVTVEKVRVHQSGTAGDSEGGWHELAVSPAKRIDLVTLTNGLLEELGSMQLPAGRYSQVRLVLAENTSSGSGAVANAVKPIGGQETALATPSATQSGLKLKANVDVAAGQTADLVLDFDACRSVVKAGDSGRYNLKPVLSVVPRVASGVMGYVTTTLSLGSTTVAAQQNGATVRSTVPDAAGKFNIPFLPAGTYTLVITSDGRATTVLTGVPAGTTTTAVNGTATAFAPPVSSMAEVTGTVSATTVAGSTTTSMAVTDADVRALQALTGGPTIEVATRAVDATNGTYSMRLPLAAPLKGTFAAGTGTAALTPDTAAAGKYTLRAQAPGRTAVERSVTLGTATTSGDLNFLP